MPLLQRLEFKYLRPGKKRRHNGKIRVFGRRSDHHHPAVFNVRQQRILLGAVETMYLIHEHNSLTFIDSITFIGFSYNRPNIRHARQHGVQRFKGGLGADGNHPRKRRFPAPGRPVQD
ncbi:MAG: hypothetical protein BWY09_02349 [Candidatus Hydrogenedentes bacterium ADurb.Bin179]|nr:MAG: hypothetical protein BWY09_02349 [Candidatus Hydrogenedentes bacterium ADurb.Bin179]